MFALNIGNKLLIYNIVTKNSIYRNYKVDFQYLPLIKNVCFLVLSYDTKKFFAGNII